MDKAGLLEAFDVSLDCYPGDADAAADVVHIGYRVVALGLRVGFVFGMVVVVEELAEFPGDGLGFFLRAKGVLAVDLPAERFGDSLGHALGVFFLVELFGGFFGGPGLGLVDGGVELSREDLILSAGGVGPDEAILKDVVEGERVVGSAFGFVFVLPIVGVIANLAIVVR
ncbi:hypothetical protein ES703_68437 [subsurface metagenome]